MPTSPVFYPANLQWVGIAKETTYGTAVSAPTAWIPVTGPKWSPNINPLLDQAKRGLMGTDFEQVAGMRYDELTYTTYCYMDTVYQHLLAFFGKADTVTGSTDPYTHKTSLYNGSGTDSAQPPSYTLFYFDGHKCQQIPGAVIVSLKIDVKVDELVTFDIAWAGLPATAMSSAPSNTPDTNTPMPAWNSTISLAGTASSKYSEVSLTYTRDTKPIPTITGSQAPFAIYGGAISVAGSLDAVYASSADLDLSDYLANTQPTLTVKMAPVGDSVHSLTLQHSVVAYDKAEPTDGEDWMTIASTVKCLMNATDALDSKQSPGQVIFLTPQMAAF